MKFQEIKMRVIMIGKLQYLLFMQSSRITALEVCCEEKS